MGTTKHIAPEDRKDRTIREQRLVVDELVAQLVLGSPDEQARLKIRLDAERRTLAALESQYGRSQNPSY
jgi:hypothetical protein